MDKVYSTNHISLKEEKTTELILKAFYSVYNELGYGFLEKVYENAMIIELESLGLEVQSQLNVKVFFKDREVGNYYVDLYINKSIVVELKAAESLSSVHTCQLTNYLKATELEVGLLLNFGKRPEFKRRVFSNINKKF